MRFPYFYRMQQKLFLLDAYALIFRAYYALIRSPRMTSTGKNTNAQFGFTNALLDLLQNQKPSHMAVCFDTSAPTERHTDFEAYKANRQETPEDIKAAVPDIIQLLEAFRIPVIAVDGYEADDVVGTLAQQAAGAGFDVYMVTPDKDYGQLVSDKIKIYKPGYQGGQAEILGPEEVCAKWGIERVDQVIDMLGLMGDAVDNIPGIPGVGEKTAAKLLKEYGTLENVLAASDGIKGSMGEKIRNGRELAVMSKKLATIITQVPVQFHPEEFRVQEPDAEKLKAVFTELEFRTMAKRILGEEVSIPVTTRRAESTTTEANTQLDLFGQPVVASTPSTKADRDLPEEGEVFTNLRTLDQTPHQYDVLEGATALNAFVKELMTAPEICFDTETTHVDPLHAHLVGMSFSTRTGHATYVPLAPGDITASMATLDIFRPLWERTDVLWVGQNIKYDMLVLRNYNIDLRGKLFDTMLAHYLIEPEGKRNMDLLAARFLQYQPVSITELIGKKGKGQGNMKDVPIDVIKEYAGEDADITLQLKQVFDPELDKSDVRRVFDTVEVPLIRVLSDMEYTGIRIDESFLRQYSEVLDADAREVEEKVYEAAGIRFNLASPKQLGEILFDKLKLDPQAKKTKTGQYSTNEDTLAKLASQHKIIDDILTFRELTKLKSTYVDALPALVHPRTGRVHTSYAQAVAVTGRLSSNNPNLQNIPIRTERGREIRKAFIPQNGDYVLLSADYSQIELRIVAAISADENLCAAFAAGKDIHTATAARIFHVSEPEVTKEMRYKAKSVNFGIIYGQGAFGLAENLGISRTEAKTIIDQYKQAFPGIPKYMDDSIQRAKEHGFVETLLGRKRWLRDIHSSNFTVRGFAERNAINSPIQGTAADMIKLAMIRIHAMLKEEGFRTKMLLQVHDELVFEVPRNEVERVKPRILETMQQALPLPHNVPVLAEVGTGDNWLEAH